jgi:hypothetical protein
MEEAMLMRKPCSCLGRLAKEGVCVAESFSEI